LSEPITTYTVEVQPRRAPLDDHSPSTLYFLRGALTPQDIDQVARTLLCDPVSETFTINTAPTRAFIDVTYLPGVTDPAAENLMRAAGWLGYTLSEAATGRRYRIAGTLQTSDALHALAERFSNGTVQRYSLNTPITPPFLAVHAADGTVEVVALRDADDEALAVISTERRLALNLPEMAAIRTYFQSEGRDPTDVELEMIAQTWSEHCVHKTFRALIDYDAPLPAATEGSTPQHIDGLLKTYIRAATETVNRDWVRSAFVDNAGIIAFDERFDLAFKVETHNHPSALEPFGGANTGVGGVIRDILGVSARPIANTDVLCFGELDTQTLPKGVLHPQRIREGVVRGIEDYGNKMGIPTVNGAMFYHPGYTSNPLVFCGCLGILPHGSHVTAPQAGDWIVVIGGRTGRDGLRGATFSSMEMDQTTGQIAGSAVQIGHPIHEKQVQEVVLRARDAKLYHAITDCGAGGLSSAVGEMAKDIGAHVFLERVPLKYPGLRPWEIWLSEAQERIVLAIPPEHWAAFQAICAEHDVEGVAIGNLVATGRLRLDYEGKTVGDISMTFLHEGIPQRRLTAVWRPTPPPAPVVTNEPPVLPTLLALLAHPNIRSRADVIQRYDHEVQGGGAVKPIRAGGEPNDGAVLVPLDTLLGQQPSDAEALRGVALSAGLAPLIGERDPYIMAFAAVDEAFRNLVAIGADPDQVALLDNFCWGNPNLPDRLGSLVRCAQGCHDAAVAYNAPYISGKDSLNNEYADETGTRHAIPATLLISAVGLVPDARKTVTSDLKAAGNALYLVGTTRDERAGSHYERLTGAVGEVLPQPVSGALDLLRALHKAVKAGHIAACHDPSEGGIGVALAEMCLNTGLAAVIDLSVAPGAAEMPNLASVLFSESLTRFIVEVPFAQIAPFEALMAGIPHARIGTVTADERLILQRGKETVSLSIAEAEKAFGTPSRPPAYGDNAPTPIAITRRERQPLTVQQGKKRVIILHANGSNRDRDAALAVHYAGGEPEIVHMNALLKGERSLMGYHMLIVPGGFSHGDDLGAGKLWALALEHQIGDAMRRFVAEGRPVLGICNGFQTLVKAGILPGIEGEKGERLVTLTFNESHQFECRWVTLQANPFSPCLFTDGITERIACPVAHGEGRLLAVKGRTLDRLWQAGVIALTYAGEGYPDNPNGSQGAIAGLTNPAGNVLGLMPHPENHIFPWQHPDWRREERGQVGLGLTIFQNGVNFA